MALYRRGVLEMPLRETICTGRSLDRGRCARLSIPSSALASLVPALITDEFNGLDEAMYQNNTVVK